MAEVELFGGYSYLRTHAGPAGGAYNLNGWEGSMTGEINGWIGGEADFSNHYGIAPPTFLDQSPRFSYLFGPRFAFPVVPRVTPFAHALFGAVRGAEVVYNVCPAVVVTPPCSPPSTRPQTSFGMAYGGGLDVRATRILWLRLFQADYVRSGKYGLTNDRRKDLPVSAGIVLRFGKK